MTIALYVPGDRPDRFGKAVDAGAASTVVSAYDAVTGDLAWRFYVVPGDPTKEPDGAASDQALAEIALRIAPGDFVAITGPSGCGKSTLLSILGLLDAPSHGRYLLNGRDVGGLDARGRAHRSG